MENCPLCKREFKQAIDYPFIHLTDFEKFQIPEIVFGDQNYEGILRFNELPWRVRRRFRGDNDLRRTDYRGYVYQLRESSDLDFLTVIPSHRYYQSGKDFRKEAIATLDNKKFKEFLESLEGNVGRTLELDEALKRTYREDDFRNTFGLVDQEKRQEVELSFEDKGVFQGNGNFYIGLVGVSDFPNPNTRISLYFRRTPIARVGYEGRLER